MLATTLHLYSQTPLWSSARAVFKSASLMILQRRHQRGPGGGCPLQKKCPPWATAWEGLLPVLRTRSFCTVAWQLALARFQLTRRIARSLGDS